MSVSVREGSLADHLQLVNVRMEDAVHEAYAGRLVGVVIWELDMDLPEAALKRRCRLVSDGGFRLVAS